jgi:hypothetical protein
MRISPIGNSLRPAITAIGLFLVFGSSMAALAGTMLIWPGTRLDRLWSLNETAHAEFRKAGSYLGPLFWGLSIALVGTAVGWFRQRVWAFRLTVAIVGTQVAGDLVNIARGDFVRGGVGVLIAGALLLYLLGSNIRTPFRSGA